MKILIRWSMVAIILLGGFELYQFKRTARYINASQIAQGLAAASEVRVRMLQYFMENGSLPTSNQDLGLPPPTRFASTSLKSISITRHGAIELVYKKSAGIDDARILLIPKIDSETSTLQWQCISQDFTNIAKVAPQCRYANGALGS